MPVSTAAIAYKITRPAADGPREPAVGSVTCTPVRRREVDGQVILPAPYSTALDEDGVAPLVLEVPDPEAWGWRIVEDVEGGATRYVVFTAEATAPDQLVDVDPRTFATLADPAPAWWAFVTALQAALDAAILAGNDYLNLTNRPDIAGMIAAASALDRDRANHAGTQSSATISDFAEAAQDAVAALLAGTSGVQLSYDDAGNQLTITGGGDATGRAEEIRDAIGVALLGTGVISVTVNDALDTITISSAATQNAPDAALRDRSTHTGSQAISTITGLQAALDAKAEDAFITQLVGVQSNTPYPIPSGAKLLVMRACGVGGAGASGRRGAPGTVRCGGGGGGGGGYVEYAIPVAELTALGVNTLYASIGAPPAGGAGVTVNDTDGNPGGATGTATVVKTSNASNNAANGLLEARAGVSGSGGTATQGLGGAGGIGKTNGASGVAASVSGGAGTNGSGGATAGGASGAGLTSADGQSAGGVGGYVQGRFISQAAAGTSGGGTGTNGLNPLVLGQGGSGGGGGSRATGGPAGDAGTSGYGAGGSGGGASSNGNNSGAGAAGGIGFVEFVAIF